MIRKCADCGKEWEDDGDYLCQFCGSENTYVVQATMRKSPELDKEEE